MPASARLRRFVLAFSSGLVTILLSPGTRFAAADDNGLGAGGALFAFNFTLVVGIILAFLFGFGLRDYIHKRVLRAKGKKPTPPPSRP